AAAVSLVAGVGATIVPFEASRARWRRVQLAAEATVASGTGERNGAGSRREAAGATMAVPEGCVPIAQAPHRRTAVLQGRIRSCEVSPISGSPALRCELVDESGGVTLLFYGRRAIPGIEPGATVQVEGRVGDYRGHLAMANPIYRLLPRDGAVAAT
ncbi:MAG: OB-fold nucleic acid binding domain-containing protein, partial [Oryzihumus sp.]